MTLIPTRRVSLDPIDRSTAREAGAESNPAVQYPSVNLNTWPIKLVAFISVDIRTPGGFKSPPRHTPRGFKFAESNGCRVGLSLS